jgi:hypothetical protein
VDGQRKALIVANDEYEHEGLRHLLAPAADAQALARVLGDSQIGDFDVRVVRNEPAHVIQAQIEELFADTRPDDVLLLHFSCHGLKSESGELFFAARNTRPNRLASTAIAADFVQRCMRASRSRSIVLLLDCCYGGAFGQGVTVRAAEDVNVLDSFPGGRLGGGRGRAVITASSSMEYAFEGDQLADDHSQRPSVFTSALVEGLATGDADRDEDGWVSLNELYDYIFDRVREQTPHQTPSRDIEMQGELYLARSRRRRIHPLPIPADLHAAMTDTNMFTRIGAVSELRTRLTSDNLPAAAGAHDALAEIVRADIQYVAEAAATALRAAAIQPAEHELHFGQVAKDSSPAHHTVHLLGPPLARACTFEVSANWIRVEETSEGFVVSVDTSTAGALRGVITFKGPTGEAMIPIDVEVIPRPPQPPPPSTKPSPPTGEPSDRPVPASTPARTPQPDGSPAQPATRPTPDSPSPAPAQTGTVTPGGPSPAEVDASPGEHRSVPVVREPETAPAPTSPRRAAGVVGAASVAILVLALAVVIWPRGRDSPAPQQSPTQTPSSTLAPGIWRPRADLGVELEAAGTAIYHGSLWVIGGLSHGEASNVVRIYDPKDDTWRDGPTLPVALDHAPAATDGDHLYVVGGLTGAGQPRPARSEVYRLDGPDDRTWATATPLPEPRAAGAVAWDGSRLVFAGGQGSDEQDHSEVWAFDDEKWAPIGRLQQPREHLAAATDGKGTVWFLAGLDRSLRQLTDAVDAVHGQRVERVTSFPIPKVRKAGAVWLPELGICLLGGQTRSASGPLTDRVQCQRKTPPLPNLPSPRAAFGAAVLDGAIYMVAGRDQSGSALSRTDALQVYR